MQVFGSRGPDHGFAEIWVDGFLMASLDLWAAELETRQVIFEMDELPFGFHEVTVRVLGKRREGATRGWVAVDAAVVTYRSPGPSELPMRAAWERVALPEREADK